MDKEKRVELAGGDRRIRLCYENLYSAAQASPW